MNFLVQHIFTLALLLIASLNYSNTRVFIFVIPLISIIYFFRTSQKAVFSYFFLLLLASVFNYNLEKNKWIFPILKQSEIGFPHKGYYVKYSNGDGAYIYDYNIQNECIGCSSKQFKEILLNQPIKIKSIQIDTMQKMQVHLITEFGKLNQGYFDFEKSVSKVPYYLSKTLNLSFLSSSEKSLIITLPNYKQKEFFLKNKNEYKYLPTKNYARLSCSEKIKKWDAEYKKEIEQIATPQICDLYIESLNTENIQNIDHATNGQFETLKVRLASLDHIESQEIYEK